MCEGGASAAHGRHCQSWGVFVNENYVSRKRPSFDLPSSKSLSRRLGQNLEHLLSEDCISEYMIVFSLHKEILEGGYSIDECGSLDMLDSEIASDEGYFTSSANEGLRNILASSGRQWSRRMCVQSEKTEANTNRVFDEVRSSYSTSQDFIEH